MLGGCVGGARACSRSSAGCSRRSPGPGRAVAATRRPSATCSARAWCSTSSSPSRSSARCKASLDPRSFTIATFALCGFANFSSIGIQIGGIGALAPKRRHDLARLGLRAMLAGTLANFVTATIAGIPAVKCGLLSTTVDDRRPRLQPRRARPRSPQRARRSRSCSAPASAPSPARSATRSRCRTRELPHWPASRVVGHAGQLVVGTVGAGRSPRCRAAATSTKATTCRR